MIDDDLSRQRRSRPSPQDQNSQSILSVIHRGNRKLEINCVIQSIIRLQLTKEPEVTCHRFDFLF